MRNPSSKTRNAGRTKSLVGGRKRVPAKDSMVARQGEAKAFNKVLDEVIRDYASTLSKLA